jgi:hypothetical protein
LNPTNLKSAGILVLIIIAILAIGYFVWGQNILLDGFTVNTNVIPIPSDGIIPDGYYKINDTTMGVLPQNSNIVSILPNEIPDGYYVVILNGEEMLALVPPGYTASDDKLSIQIDTNSPDHDYDPNTFVGPTPTYNSEQDTNPTVNPNATLAPIVSPSVSPTVALTTMPNYLIIPTSVPTLPKVDLSQYTENDPTKIGFCAYETDNAKIEQKCNALNTDVCATTSCCVLVGGKKCSAGNKTGPTLKSVYGDPTVTNKDMYYYMGKCYGNCY